MEQAGVLLERGSVDGMPSENDLNSTAITPNMGWRKEAQPWAEMLFLLKVDDKPAVELLANKKLKHVNDIEITQQR